MSRRKMYSSHYELFDLSWSLSYENCMIVSCKVNKSLFILLKMNNVGVKIIPSL